MLGARGYKTKAELKRAVGQPLRFVETSAFGTEYKETGDVTMVGPDAYAKRDWYATISLKDGVIVKVK